MASLTDCWAMNGIKIAYYGSTGLLTALLLLGVSMYVFNHAEVAAAFL